MAGGMVPRTAPAPNDPPRPDGMGDSSRLDPEPGRRLRPGGRPPSGREDRGTVPRGRGRAEGSPARPVSMLVYGPNRPLVNLVLFAMAERASRALHWLELRAASEPTPDLAPSRLGWIAHDHLWIVDPLQAWATAAGRADATLREVIRSDESPETLAQLSAFLRLPEEIRRILTAEPPAQQPGVLAIANSDRTPPGVAEGALPPMWSAIDGAGFSLFVGFGGSPPEARSRFESVLRVDGPSPYRWREATVTLERGSAPGVLQEGETVGLGDLPFAARVLRRAVGER
jgi:hypothetical protein